MNYGLQVLIVSLAAIAGMCGIHKAADHQQRSLEARCQCHCAILSTDDPETFDRWLRGDSTLTMAWGGGVWQCPAR